MLYGRILPRLFKDGVMNIPKPSPVSPQADSGLVHSYSTLVCHLGELTLKGGNRSYFEDRLVNNLRAKFGKLDISWIRLLPGRILIEFKHPVGLECLTDKASTSIGIANALPVLVAEPCLPAIEAAVKAVTTGLRFDSFAVRCTRAEKRFPQTSQEICQQMGRLVQELHGARVDLSTPQLTIWIEVLSHHVLVGTHRIPGPAGLPVGVSGQVVCLLSAGIDSPVAAWRMMTRGCEPILLHFHSAPFTSPASQEKVRELGARLARWHAPVRLAMIPFGDVQQEIVAKTPEPYRVLLYRRMMMRIAAAVARSCGAGALVTGDSLAQVASQTIPNLAAVETVSPLPIFRPLIGMDKNEIIRTARQLGTYDISIEPHADCCTFFEPRHPVIKSRVMDLERIEAALAIDALIAHTLQEGPRFVCLPSAGPAGHVG